VEEVWFVLGPEAQPEVYRRPVSGEFSERAVHGPDGSFTGEAVPDFTVERAAVFGK
jgi:hypothetical protein